MRACVLVLLAASAVLSGCGGCEARGAEDGSRPTRAVEPAPLLGSPSPSPASSTGATPSCAGPLFIDAIPSGAWVDVAVRGGGMDAIRQAIDASDKQKPTRITVDAGTYEGQCLYVEDHLRSASAPLWIRAKGLVQIACHDGNGQAVGFDHVAYIAFDGFTIGPERGFYGDSAVHIAGKPNQPKDMAHYGDYDPAHHVIVRNLTARNLNRGPDGDQNPDAYESGCCDAVKVNQASDVWILDSHVRRTARHGFDAVGVHREVVCNNVLEDMVGAGVGMEAKGGSEDVLFEGNLIRRARTRGVVLGGEGSGNVYMWPWDAAYEGRREIARNNVIINASEAGIGFYGCQGCAAVSNSVWVTSGYSKVTDKDMLRAYNSTMEGGDDYWGGSKRVGQTMANLDNVVVDNLFGVADGSMTCPLNANADAVRGLVFTNNLWWNGGKALPDCGEGPTSIVSRSDPGSSYGAVDPQVRSAGTFDTAPDLTPRAQSPLVAHASGRLKPPSRDLHGKTRPPKASIGAVEP